MFTAAVQSSRSESYSLLSPLLPSFPLPCGLNRLLSSCSHITKKNIFNISPAEPGWCSARPGTGSAGCTQTLFLEKMISPSSPERNDEPPAPGLNVRRSEALEEARRRSRPRDISSGTGTLGPSSECGVEGEF